MAPGNPDLPIVLRRPGLVRVRCDVHAWMGAAILVLEHGAGAATDAHGAFELRAPRAGEVRMRVWHARLGEKGEAVKVQGEVEMVTVELP